MKTLFLVMGVIALVALVPATAYLAGRYLPLSATDSRQSDAGPEDVRALELQRMCAQQAQKHFDDYYATPQQDVLSSQTNHYSKRLGKCFVLVGVINLSKVASEGYDTVIEELTDAFEGVGYGNVIVTHYRNASPPKPDFVICNFTPPGDPQRSCQSKDEWNTYVATYMED